MIVLYLFPNMFDLAIVQCITDNSQLISGGVRHLIASTIQPAG
jgi:hypothetical protein